MPSRIPFHRPAAARTATPESRTEANRFYASKRWRITRREFLKANPLCVDCRAADRLEPAVEVHHKQKRVDHPDLAFDESNLEGLCKSCHSRRTGSGQ